ncbi:endogenous retrovirus group K member 113 Gag polyprotein-like [Heterocephalus glaber]|uniref:Endogenous retrovirus group K member 113 Gag polyprotein-like n=1 Tax=Heterocephalus glaber TaxID=10181 RepID=A0AAX6R7F6_HETGA|nr:endogenous retrovirus group K member 113 Gag polyprotein-like [Heterocephalus glaber]
MGNGNSRMLFVHLLKNMLHTRGAKVGHQQLRNFLEFVEKVCPWFPEEGTVDLEVWNKVGKQLQDYYDGHGSTKVPIDTFSLWALIRDSLDPQHERERVKGPSSSPSLEESDKTDVPEVVPPPPIESETKPSAPPVYADAEPALRKGLFPDEGPLEPGDADDLEEEAARYNNEDWTPLPVVATAKKPEKFKWSTNEDVTEKIARLEKTLESLCQQWQTGLTVEEEDQKTQGEGGMFPSIIAGLDPPPVVGPKFKKKETDPLIAMIKHPPGPRPLSVNSRSLLPLQATLQHAVDRGEDTQGFHLACPVFEEADAQGNMVRTHRPIPFKQLKELKIACAQYGPTAPFTQAMLESLSTDALLPGHWKQLAKACLSGGDFLL